MPQTRWQKLKLSLMLRAVGLYRHLTLGVRCAVLSQGAVLMVRHGYVAGWHLPGGGVDPGETVLAAGKREVLEETGYRVAGDGRLFGLYHSTLYTNRDHVALYVFDGAAKHREFMPSAEISEIGWFDLETLPEETSPATRRRLDEIAGRRLISLKW